MGNNYDIILIGLVAIFLILRLRSVLGKRTGNERPPARDPFAPPTPPPPAAGQPRIGDAPSGNDNVIPLPNSNAPSPRPPLAANAPGGIRSTVLPAAVPGVAAIRTVDPGFEPIGFAGGARAAFTTIVEAFAKGDIGTLQALLDAADLRQLQGSDRGRIERGEKAETTLIGFEASDIAMARDAGQLRRRSPSASSASRSTSCATPTARSPTAIPTKCRRSWISGRSAATPSPATRTGC